METYTFHPDDVTENFQNVPYAFVADDAFLLRLDILKPFRQGQLDSREKEIFNYRISQIRHIVENVFSIVAARFRIFHSPINLDPKNIEKVVMAACALRNFLIEEQSSLYAPSTLLYEESTSDGSIISLGCDSSNSNMKHLNRQRGNSTNAAKENRNKFMQYFINEGAIPWQNKHIMRKIGTTNNN